MFDLFLLTEAKIELSSTTIAISASSGWRVLFQHIIIFSDFKTYLERNLEMGWVGWPPRRGWGGGSGRLLFYLFIYHPVCVIYVCDWCGFLVWRVVDVGGDTGVAGSLFIIFSFLINNRKSKPIGKRPDVTWVTSINSFLQCKCCNSCVFVLAPIRLYIFRASLEPGLTNEIAPN